MLEERYFYTVKETGLVDGTKGQTRNVIRTITVNFIYLVDDDLNALKRCRLLVLCQTMSFERH